MNQPLTKALWAGFLAVVLGLAACTSPLQAPAGGKVVVPTPYGKRYAPASPGYFQSTVVPQNLEALVDHFRVTLRGTGGLADRPSFTVPFGEAAEFVFDGVPPGTYDLDVQAFQYANETAYDLDAVDSYNNGSVIARGRMNGIVVNAGGLTVTDLVTVSPINRDHGQFELTLRGIPSDVTGYSFDYNIVFLNPDGTFSLLPFGGPDGDSNGTLDYIENGTFPDYLETTGLSPDGSQQQFTLKTNTNYALQTGTFFLRVKFKGADGLYHSFQPVFTIQVYKNLTSTLEVKFDDTWLGQPLGGTDLAALTNLSTSTDGTLAVTVGWNRTTSANYLSHYQIARTLDADANGPPADSDILATVPNLNGVASWPTGVQLVDPTVPKAKFWVRKIYSGMRPSNWASVTAGLGAVGGVTSSLPLVSISGPVSATAAQPVVTLSATASFVSASSTWLVDGRVVQTNPSSSIDSLVLDTSSLSAGPHQIMVKATDALGVTYSSPAYSLKVRTLPTGKVTFAKYSSSTYWLRPDGTLWAWGLNSNGQLGDGTTTLMTSPVWIANNVTDVAAGASHVLVVKADGSLWVAGNNSYGQWGNGTTSGGGSTLTKVISSGVVAVAAQAMGSYALKADGTLWSAGFNTSGALGRVTGVADTTWTQVSTDVKEVQAGDYNAFALKTDGTLWVTGWDLSGHNQLGLANHAGSVTAFTAVNLSGTIVSFSAGRFDTFVVKDDGTLWTVGGNQNGNQGNGGAVNGDFFAVPGLSGVKSVSAGGYHTAIVMNDGTVRVAGENSQGELGLGLSSATDETTFQTVPGLKAAQTAAAGLQVTAFLTNTGLFMAGHNAYGEIGNGTTINQSAPVAVSTTPPLLRVFSGLYRNFVLKPDASLWAAGDDLTGQLGDSQTTNLDTFTPVMAGSTFVSVSAGDDHTLFLKTDGSVWGVGKNESGQLGDNTVVDKFTPIQILAAGSAKAVAAGHDFSLILLVDGTVVAAGQNVGGALGQGDATDRLTFTPVSGVSRIVALAVGLDFSMLLKADGTLLTAGAAPGNYYNQVGDAGGSGVWTPHYSFNSVLTGVSAIAAGEQFALAAKVDGSLWVAGSNSYGQLGLGNVSDATSGFVQALATGVDSVAAGSAHSLVRMRNGSLWGMGYAYPVGSGSNQWSAVLIDSNVKTMAAGGYHTYFTRGDGSLWWMGTDNYNVNGIASGQGSAPAPQRVF